MELHETIEPLGILTYTLMLLTIISGFKHWKLKYHMSLAVTTILFATMHALLVLLLH